MINFSHISPTSYLKEVTKHNGFHLLLAHLVENDPRYREFYANLNDGKIKCLDNSAFELYKQGRPMYPSDKLIEMGKACKADVIVLSDYPGSEGAKTINSAILYAPIFKKEGFKTFFVPQSTIGDLDDYVRTFKWAVDNEDVADMIGVSILGVPNAFGVERGNKLQRYVSRLHMMNILKKEGVLAKLAKSKNPKKLHFLGMVDGPNEVELVKEFHEFIYSWDSSAAVWAGLNGIEFDVSPTGLIDGKFEKEVDFGFEEDVSTRKVFKNIAHINRMCGMTKIGGTK